MHRYASEFSGKIYISSLTPLSEDEVIQRIAKALLDLEQAGNSFVSARFHVNLDDNPKDTERTEYNENTVHAKP